MIQDEGDDEDEWNVSMAASTSLALFAQCIRDDIIGPNGHVMKFVETHIGHADWRFREAAVMAFGKSIVVVVIGVLILIHECVYHRFHHGRPRVDASRTLR